MVKDLISREALERIIKRAAELQAGEHDVGDGLTNNEVLALGKDVGIPDRYLRQAILEEQTRTAPEVATGTWAWLTGPRSIVAHRVVPGDREAVERALSRWMTEDELLQPKRHFADRTSWEPKAGAFASIQRALAGRRRYSLAQAGEVTAQVVQLEPGFCLVRLEADIRPVKHETQSRLQRHHLGGHLSGLCQRVAASSRQRALNRSECARFGLPRRAVGKMPFGLQQLVFGHPATQRALDRLAIAGNDSVRHDRPGTSQPRPRPGRDFGRSARLFFQDRLTQVAVRNSDVLPERQDLVIRETVADVVFSGLQLGGALDDALQRLTTDEVPSLAHQTFAFPLLRTAGKRSPAVRSGRARLPESSSCAGASRSMKPLNRSIGMGKIVVELFSEAISLTVCR